MSYELILRASYENNKEVLYKSPNINGDFVISGYTSSNDAPPLHRAGIINDACFNLLSSTNTYPNVSIDTINTSNATLASEDFTISFWCNIQKDSVAQNTVLFSATDGHNYSWSATKGTFLLLGNPVRLLYDNTTYLTSKNTLKLVDGQNHFICIERKNDTLYVFIDGKLEIEDDIATRFGVAHYPFANVKFSVGNGGAEDSDGTKTLKRSMLVDGYTLIKGICIWDKEFTPPKRDTWDLISNGYLDTTGLAYYHNKIVEYINKNSIESSNKILDWKPKKGYNKGEMVYYDNILYRAKSNVTSGTDFTQEQNNWELVCTQIPEWTSSCYYVQGVIVEYNNKIYKCKTTNSDVAFTESNWTNIGGGSNADYKQITKLNITAPKTELISINVTNTFAKAPCEILKFVEGEDDVVVILCDFDNSDSTDFEDNEFLIFDGNMSLKTIYDIAVSTPTQLVKGYCSITDDIDLTKFKSVEEMGVVQ